MRRDGRSRRRTPLFVGGAGELGLLVALAIAALVALLVRVVATVVVAVAQVDARDAVAVVAREQVAEAGPRPRLALVGRLVGSCSVRSLVFRLLHDTLLCRYSFHFRVGTE